MHEKYSKLKGMYLVDDLFVSKSEHQSRFNKLGLMHSCWLHPVNSTHPHSWQRRSPWIYCISCQGLRNQGPQFPPGIPPLRERLLHFTVGDILHACRLLKDCLLKAFLTGLYSAFADSPLLDCSEPPSEEESIVILRRDPLLVDALRQSRRLGDMLLKNEERELAQVNQLVDDLLNQEYRCAAS